MTEQKEFPQLKNTRLLDVISGKRVDKSPVWIMRQAGRYLPEFREVRAKHDFFTICRTPSLACEVTLQPLRRYEGLLDASIIFSDILVVPQALGMIVEMKEKVGPQFPFPLTDPSQFFNGTEMGDVDRSQVINPKVDCKSALSYVYEAVTTTRLAINGQVPLFGFCGAPWTLLAYMVEGGGSKMFNKIKSFIFTYPEETKQILDVITSLCIEHLVLQAEAGAQALQVFDSWAGELSHEDFLIFSYPYLRRIATEVKSRTGGVPTVVFAKGAHYAIPDLVHTDYDVIGLDWTMNPQEVQNKVQKAQAITSIKKKFVLQGNLDPSLLYAPHDVIVERTTAMLQNFLLYSNVEVNQDFGYICNLGHGIHPTVPVENVKVFLETVKDVTSKLFAQQQ
ncbi:hypothetical protein MIR68_005163 [Amoeboaphelidium protococcarum]|nr:hypothetical protein MIR68_005163 [Amoeboaphelidium protococcarum]